MRAKASQYFDLRTTGVDAAERVAARVLAEGGLAIVPTETVYGVFASARSRLAIRRLLHTTQRPGSPRNIESDQGDSPRFTWHAATVDEVIAEIDLPTAVHRRLIHGLLPGPVRFVVEQEPSHLKALTSRLDIDPGVISTDSWIAFRVMEHPVAHAVARMAADAEGGPLVADRLGATRWSDSDRPDTRIDRGLADELDGDAGERTAVTDAGPDGNLEAAPDVVLDVGTLPSRRPSTTVRVWLHGAFEVSPTGSIGEDQVMAVLHRSILFVCTGNTCRSPMAEAIAQMALESRKAKREREDGIEVSVSSAGVMAARGMPATPEAVEVIHSMGGDLTGHQSQPLTPELVSTAERIFVMTRDHGERAAAMVPGARDKIQTLDPNGDIPDPIGGPLPVYRDTAERLRDAVELRFEELGL